MNAHPQAHDRAAVVIVNHNGGELLPEALDALARQTVRPARTVVVDNASTDGSADLVAEHYPDVQLLALPRNVGFAAANNEGARLAADCRWVVLLNPDAFPEPRWLEALLHAAAHNPQCSFFASRMMLAERPDHLDGAGDDYHVSGLAWRRDHARRGEDSPTSLMPRESFSACGGAAMYRRDAWDTMEGFDESFFCYFEDSDLAFRLRLAGHRCRYVPDAVVHHVGSATAGASSDFTIYHSHRNMVWTWVKNMPSPLLWVYLPQFLLMNLMGVVFYSLRGQGRVVLAAKRDAARGLRSVLAERRRLQAGRTVRAMQLLRHMERGARTYVRALRGPRARR